MARCPCKSPPAYACWVWSCHSSLRGFHTPWSAAGTPLHTHTQLHPKRPNKSLYTPHTLDFLSKPNSFEFLFPVSCNKIYSSPTHFSWKVTCVSVPMHGKVIPQVRKKELLSRPDKLKESLRGNPWDDCGRGTMRRGPHFQLGLVLECNQPKVATRL